MPTSYTNTLPDDVILTNCLLTYEKASVVTKIGAGRGGLTFDPGAKRENIDFDGKGTDIEGLDYVDSYDSHIKGKFIQFNSGNLTILEPGSTSATVTGVTTITPAPTRQLFASGDYLDNLTLTFPRKNGGYAKVIYGKARCDKYQLVGTGKEGEIDCDFKGVVPAASAGTDEDPCPYVIEVEDPA